MYYEAAAVIVVLILPRRTLEARAKGRTGAAIRKLVGLAPKTARVERGGTVLDLPLDQISTGNLMHARPGRSGRCRPRLCRQPRHHTQHPPEPVQGLRL